MFFIFYEIQQVIDKLANWQIGKSTNRQIGKSPNQQIIFCILKKVRTFTEILVQLFINRQIKSKK